MTTNTNEKVWTTKDLIYILMLFLGFGKSFYTDKVDVDQLKDTEIQIQDIHNDIEKYKEETATSINILSERINLINDGNEKK